MLDQRRMAWPAAPRLGAAAAAPATIARRRVATPTPTPTNARRRSSRTLPVAASTNPTPTPLPPRRLILLRHAASEEAGRARSDHDRPVSDRGREEARLVARKLADLGWRPDLIVGSNSRRTVQTLDAMAEAHGEAFGAADAHLLGSLYTVAATDGQTRQKLCEVISRVALDGGSRTLGGGGAGGGDGGQGGGGGGGGEAGHRTVMAVGHNRGWEEAASSFARASVRLQTATAALLEHVGGAGGGGGGEGGSGGGGAAVAAVTWAEALAGEWKLVGVVSPSSSSSSSSSS
jgi:phosphohistidine phosphatase